jgi:ABC-2 type transport system ATP-binding protein
VTPGDAAGAAAPVATAAGAAPVVVVEGLRKAYGGRDVVAGITFSIERGEVFALVGPNGAGKTTTVEVLEGYRRPDGGTVRVLGADPEQAGREARARVGIMLQGGGGVDPRMTAREVLVLHGRLHAAARNADELLDLVGLTEARGTRFRRLSGGERQRLGLALALVGRPDLLVLDEPTAGMDVEARATTRGLVATLRDEGITVLFTSHDLADVERLADRIAILDRGRLVAHGSPAELMSASSGVGFRVAAGIADDDLADLARQIGPVTAGPDGWYRIDAAASPTVVAAVAAWCETRGLLIAELRTGSRTLEERYLELTGGGVE